MKRRKLSKVIFGLFSFFLMISLVVSPISCDSSSASSSSPASKERLRVATTTSLYDTGLWGYLEPLFEEKYGVELNVMYAGTGKALELGRRGDVDAVTVHSKAREEQFINDGYGVKRVPFAYNYFLIVGPETDPANIKGMAPEAAFRKLLESGESSFVSRGDDSGTHDKEKAIWQAAGYDNETARTSGVWYIEAGAGMGHTLMMANEKQAYTLTDIGTYLSYKFRLELDVHVDENMLELVPTIDSGDILLNVYSAIAVNPENVNMLNPEMTLNLVTFLTSPEIQEQIGKYRVDEYGLQLFVPYIGNEPIK